ncbi:hypothetical protein NPIL_199801 [Nephila pilipes]|uniref:Uncharacterized protein n=1 Tax=Nephila pilipes TaxID=299642 RepID=A0A8X6NZ12_NEPPI|nr:hypothetical protein NPIL_199801 [Nephila pilipes]
MPCALDNRTMNNDDASISSLEEDEFNTELFIHCFPSIGARGSTNQEAGFILSAIKFLVDVYQPQLRGLKECDAIGWLPRSQIWTKENYSFTDLEVNDRFLLLVVQIDHGG